ncbi:UNVERIFIED_CONTAM: hypothetical protein Sangu_2571700 [Sesamum angustifolium]|uniref:Retrotransposon gag domain-containing protein n=1 Tax=Sesamum angustifolium TaxID=2727405 RepID=A0AAW2J7N5_9LAMI
MSCFFTTPTNSVQQWLDQLPTRSVKSFTELSSLFQHQFASSKKYCKVAISLFRVKQEENETLKACVSRFNTAIFEVPTAHKEVLVNAFTQGLRGASFFESLAKKPTTNFRNIHASSGRKVHEPEGRLAGEKEQL